MCTSSSYKLFLFVFLFLKKQANLSNPYCSIKSYNRTKAGADLVVEFQAGKVKLMKETLRLNDTSEASRHMDLTVLARVLGKFVLLPFPIIFIYIYF